MKIESKFDLGQEVWLMWDNKAIQRKIVSVEVEVRQDDGQYEFYCIAALEKDEGFDIPFELKELFETKEELLKSL